MSRDRTFFVRLNIDDLAANIAALDGHEEKGAWLDGFMVGARGAMPRESWWEPKRIGHAFGFECFQKAEVFRLAQTEKSALAVLARAEKKAISTRNTPVDVPVDDPVMHPSTTLARSQKPEARRPESRSQHLTREKFIEWAKMYRSNLVAEAAEWYDSMESQGWRLLDGSPVLSQTHLFNSNVSAGKIVKKSSGLPLL